MTAGRGAVTRSCVVLAVVVAGCGSSGSATTPSRFRAEVSATCQRNARPLNGMTRTDVSRDGLAHGLSVYASVMRNDINDVRATAAPPSLRSSVAQALRLMTHAYHGYLTDISQLRAGVPVRKVAGGGIAPANEAIVIWASLGVDSLCAPSPGG